MAISSSQNNEILPEVRPVMPADLFRAAIKGDSDVLIHRLGLDEIQVTIEAAGPNSRNTELEHQTVVRSELIGSATRFGDTFLHLLYAGRKNNKLAMLIFSKDRSLLKARNNKLETPLHCASHVGNEEAILDLIRDARDAVKDALKETNENGDTTLHLAVNNHQGDVVVELMKLDSEVAHKENKQGCSPWYIALCEGNTSMVKAMLEVDPDLAVAKFSDGTFPVHVAACTNNKELVEHFWKEPDDAKLQDHRGRNLFHFAAEHDSLSVVHALTQNDISSEISKMVDEMINARDFEGNTPLHIAEMKGHRQIMSDIWYKLKCDEEKLLPNQKGKRPVLKSMTEEPSSTKKNMMELPSSNNLKKMKVSVFSALITSALGISSTIINPGGIYNVAECAPVLGGRFMFTGFVIVKSLAFVLGCTAVIYLLFDPTARSFNALCVSAWRCMIIGIGLESYAMLAGVSMPIATVILVVALFVALPAFLLAMVVEFLRWALEWKKSSSMRFWELAVVTGALIFMSIFFFASWTRVVL